MRADAPACPLSLLHNLSRPQAEVDVEDEVLPIPALLLLSLLLYLEVEPIYLLVEQGAEDEALPSLALLPLSLLLFLRATNPNDSAASLASVIAAVSP